MATAAPAEPYRHLRLASMAAVLAAHGVALWGAVAWSHNEPPPTPPAVLAVSFVAPQPVEAPVPLPPAPPPPKPVVQPKPKPLITSRATEPVPDAIVAPPEPEQPQEPAEPVAAYSPAAAEPAEKAPPEPPRYDMAYLQNPFPPYPSTSRRMREEGTVALLVRVSATGDAVDVQVSKSSGYSRLDEAAVRAVRRWKFKPSKRGDEAVEGVALVPIVFSLKQS
jgi:periplasmic protein TonB